MSLLSQILAMWLLSIAIPVVTLIYIVVRFGMSDNNTGSLFDMVRVELDSCRDREARLMDQIQKQSARIEELIKRVTELELRVR